ncbi:2-amino-4-hydroxy-6-hydroxymethyldihydropteridine diphosphokinase [Paraflavitalea speifideaquila]|uniref:2-amino-4-hydroxy-6- hydroxymethyldihydropteridine diphosphokinase n=1 Tax=Paraflavitalea speifideaquila TaxID=3076558 RepID=UPI0028EDACD8|nr:2-amino-4-hydroxy-6-hydroxymethyldihydropteridine diphosphokinase [Paraflavitalea speifideiaquila]
MNNVYLLIGGNVGNRLQHLQQAVMVLNQSCGRVERQSAIYETAAWGKTDQQPFLNQALLLATPFTAPELLQHTLAAENVLGRVRQERYGPVLLILIYYF